MDMQHDVTFRAMGLDRVSTRNGQLLQWHSDGGARQDGSAASAFTLTLLYNDEARSLKRKPLFAKNRLLRTGTSSATAEQEALILAMKCCELVRLENRVNL